MYCILYEQGKPTGFFRVARPIYTLNGDLLGVEHVHKGVEHHSEDEKQDHDCLVFEIDIAFEFLIEPIYRIEFLVILREYLGVLFNLIVNDQILLTVLHFRDDPVDIHIFLFSSYLQKLVLLVRNLIEVVGVHNQKEHDHHHRWHLYHYHDHRRQNYHDVVREDVGVERKTVRYDLVIRRQHTNQLVLAVRSLVVLDRTRFRLVVLQLVHEDVLVDVVTDALSFIQIRIREVVGPEIQPHCESESQTNYEDDLTLLAFSQIYVGIHIVVIVVGKDCHESQRNEENYVLFRFVIKFKSTEGNHTFFLHFIQL